MAGYTIGVASDTKAFSQGIATGVVKPLTDAQQTIEALADSSATASDRIEAALKAEQDATQQNAKAHSAAANQAGTDNVLRVNSEQLSARESNRIQKEALKTGASAIAQNIAQTASGFDGSVSGALNTGTNIAATLGATMGGVAGLVASGVSLLVGVVTGLFQKSEAEAKAFKADVADLAGEFIKAGDAGKASLGDISDALEKLATETDPTKASLDSLYKSAHDAGDSFKTVALAQAGQLAGAKEALQVGKDKLAQDNAQIDANAKQLDQQASAGVNDVLGLTTASQVSDSINKKTGAQKDFDKYLSDSIDKAKAAAKEYRLWVEAGGPQIKELGDRTKQLDSALTDVGDDVKTFIDKQGAFNANKFVKSMEAEEKALANYNDELAKSGLSTSAKEYLDGLPAQQAAAVLKAYEKAGPALKEKLSDQFTKLGKAANGDYAGAFTGTTIDAPKVKTPTLTPAQIKRFKTDTEQQFASLGGVKIPVKLVTRSGKSVP